MTHTLYPKRWKWLSILLLCLAFCAISLADAA